MTSHYEFNVDKEGDYKLILENLEDAFKFSKQVSLSKVKNTTDLDFIINNPKLWWTRNIGTPHLYRFRVELRNL